LVIWYPLTVLSQLLVAPSRAHAGFTQALYLRLESEFASGDLFMDVEGHIKPGDDFVEVLNAQVAASDVVGGLGRRRGDMHGNVYEWCEDAWHDNYNGAPTDGSAWLQGEDGNLRVARINAPCISTAAVKRGAKRQ
jgi:hypothetical protein